MFFLIVGLLFHSGTLARLVENQPLCLHQAAPAQEGEVEG